MSVSGPKKNLDPETVIKYQFLVKNLLDPKTDVLDQFLAPETTPANSGGSREPGSQ